MRGLRCQNAHRQWFIPQQSLRQLMSKDKIREALRESGTKAYLLDETTSFVFKNGVKIFSILILIHQSSLIDCFIKSDQLQDRRLPFDSEFLKNEILIDYTQENAQEFYEKQWEFIAPEFFRGTLTRSLNKNVVLPFITNKEIDEGGFGTVYEIALHPDHQKLDNVFGQRVSMNLLSMND